MEVLDKELHFLEQLFQKVYTKFLLVIFLLV